MFLPRFMIAAPNSGSGKTTVVCALLKALLDQEYKVAAFKSGPDYIDPMFHSRVIGAKSRYGSGEPCVESLEFRSVFR